MPTSSLTCAKISSRGCPPLHLLVLQFHVGNAHLFAYLTYNISSRGCPCPPLNILLLQFLVGDTHLLKYLCYNFIWGMPTSSHSCDSMSYMGMPLLHIFMLQFQVEDVQLFTYCSCATISCMEYSPLHIFVLQFHVGDAHLFTYLCYNFV